MKIVDTTQYKIFCGLKEGYEGVEHSMQEAYDICQRYCDKHPFGVEVSPTKFIYHKGCENGAVISIINYPRFPKTDYELRQIACELAFILMTEFKQERISIVGSDSTLMLEKSDLNSKTP